MQVEISRGPHGVKQLSFRKMKSVDTDKSREDIRNSTLCQNTPDDLGTLAACYQQVIVLNTRQTRSCPVEKHYD